MKSALVAASFTLLALGGCAASGRGAPDGDVLPPPAGLMETYWKAVELDGAPVPPADGQREAHLVLRAEAAPGDAGAKEGALPAQGSTGCNRLVATYTADERNLRFTPGATTRMACLPGNPEPAFLKAIAATRQYRIGLRQSDELELLDASGRVVARFRATALH